ncbi:MAG: alpha-2-macroglobulin family protein [Bacteroidia bacterium]
MRFLTLLILFFLASQCLAQDLLQSARASQYTYVYSLTDADAKTLYQKGPLALGESAFTQLVDSFLSVYGQPASLPPGHYLETYVQDAQLHIRYLPIMPLQLEVLNDKRALHLMVFDPQGKAISEAEISIDDRSLAYDAESKTYYAPNRKRGGLVEISYLGQKNWYNLNRKDQERNFRTFYGWVFNLPTLRLISWRLYRLGYAIVRPYRFLSMPRDWWYRIVQRSQAFYKPQNRYRSYVAFNKPIYRQADTLRAKFVLLKRKNGAPVDKEIKAFTRNRDGKRLDVPLQHPRPGVYMIDWVLTDSLKLQLDRYYTIYLEQGNKTINASGSFRYEDYELSRVKFAMRVDSNKVFAGIPINIYASAKDENDLPAPDARIKLYLINQLGGEIKWRASAVFISDTLWQWQQALDPVGETQVAIPDSVWPSAIFRTQLNATISTSDNETQSFTENLQYKHRESNLAFRDRLDSLQIIYQEKGQSVAKMAWVQLLDQWRNPIWEDSLQLPFTLPLRGTFSHVKVITKDHQLSFDMGEPMVGIAGNRTRDSLVIQTQNPRNLPIWYSLFRGNKLLEQGQAEQLQLRRAVSEREYYFLSTRHVWKGQVIEQNYRFRWYPNQVNLNLEHPEQVAPGSLVPIKITATDVDSQAIVDFDLALYGYTAKFKKPQAPSMPIYAPQWENRIGKRSFNRQSRFDDTNKSRLLDYPAWAAKAGLDTLAWYHFRYPAGERYQYSFPIEDTLAQFAPYVFHQGLQCEPIIIYLDERPVYYEAQRIFPFSFRTLEGYHNIRIRLWDREISMDSVWLAAGQKTIVSVDQTKLASHTTWRSAKPELSVTERALIRNYFTYFRFPFQSKVSVQQGQTLHYLESSTSGNYLLGPFTPNTSLTIRGEGWGYEIPKKQGYSYEIFPQYAQLNPARLMTSKHVRLYRRTGEPYEISGVRKLPAKEVFETKNIGSNQAQVLWSLIPYQNQKKDCRLLASLPESLQERVLFTEIIGEDSLPQRIYPRYVSELNALPVGNYRLNYWMGDKNDISTYLQTPSVSLREKGINYHRWEPSMVESVTDTAKKLFLKRLAETEAMARDSLRIADASSGFAYRINGRILDRESGEPLSFATVLHFDEDGFFRSGGNTDENGWFTIPVIASTFELHVKYLGGTAKQVFSIHEWNGEFYTDLNSGAKFDTVAMYLDEVKVIGYASTERKNVKATISQVNSIPMRGLPPNRKLKRKSLAEPPNKVNQARNSDGLLNNTADSEAENELEIPFGDAKASSLRTNFRDYAFWYPNLKTGADGTVEVQARIPDDITQWDLFALGHNDQRQLGKTTSQMQAYRMLSGQIVLPRFLIPGDSVRLIGKSINYSGDTFEIDTEFAMEDSIVLRSNHQLSNAVLDTAYFRVPQSALDSLQFRYQLTRKSDGYQDGEQRDIPLYRPGIEESEGAFWAFWQDTSLTYRGDRTMGPLYINVEADLLSSLRSELRRLRNYPHACNEQTASKLTAFLYERKISEQLGENFSADAQIKRLIKKLIRNQNKDASWGWWPEMDGNMWVSLHVIEALMLARAEGFTVDFREEDIKASLLFNLETYAVLDQYRALDLLSQMDAKLDYQSILDSLLPASYGHSRYLVENYLLRQRYDLPMEMDSLLSNQKKTQFGTLFGGEESYRVTNNAFLTSLRVFELLRSEEAYQREAALTLNYLLAGRKPYYWRNTYESANALAAILPDLLAEQGADLKPQIWIDGELISQFPYRDTLGANAQLDIKFDGRLPVYATAYQNYWNPAPKAAQSPFEVKTYFLNVDNDTLTELKAGEGVRLITEVKLQSEAEYLSLQVPIPAGCSYAEKRVWWAGESYREYKREQTEIYCRRLPAGTHRFEVKLMPRFGGGFNLRTARAEMMYFPLFFGQNEQKRIKIR